MVDKIAVSEELQRFEAQRRNMEAGITAGKALLWFEEYAKSEKSAADIVTLSIKPVASSTPNADLAAKYLEQAAATFADQIIEAAIASAQASFRATERLRKGQDNG